MNLADALKVLRTKPDGSGYTVAAGTTDATGDVIDTADCEGVIIVTGFGAITAGAVTSVKLQGGNASDGGDAADLAASHVTVADTDDSRVVVHDIFRPAQRYVRALVDRGTQNAVVDFQLAIKYGVKTQPVADDATVVAAGRKVQASPAAGTA